jgi:hypothetical protein
MNTKIYLLRILMAINCLLAGTIFAAAYAPSYYSASSRLASGHWVKIKVNETGMQEISYATLQALGYSHPENVVVYGYGGTALINNTFTSTLPDDLPATPTLHTNNKLIFYGESSVRNNLGSTETTIDILRNGYDNAGYYFISDVQPSDNPELYTAPYNAEIESVRDYHMSLSVDEQEVTCPSKAGTDFFGNDISQLSPFTYTLHVDNPYSTTATLRFSLAAKANTTTMLSFSFPSDVSLNSSTTARANGVYEDTHIYYNRGTGNSVFRLRTDTNNQDYTITSNLRSSSDIEYAALDYMALIYRRHNILSSASQNRLIFFNPTSATSFRVSGTTSNMLAWDVTDPFNIYAYELYHTDDNDASVISASFSDKCGGKTAYIEFFDPMGAQYIPEIIGNVEAQNLHAIETPEMLIVTTNKLLEYANSLAQLHREHQGLTVKVVNADAIYNEFSSGTKHPMGIRRFAKMLYDRDPQKFRYLLLYGGGSYDNRSILMPTEDYLLTYQCESRTESNSSATAYCTDAIFGMLSDDYDHQRIHYAPMSIAVGRIPALNTSDAQQANTKIQHYLENPPTAPAINRAVILADAGDENSHIAQAEEIATTILNQSPCITVTKAYNTLYPLTDNGSNIPAARSCILNALSSGVRYLTYSGHGSADALSFENYYQKSHIQSHSYDFFPFVMLATCDVFSFDRTNSDMGSAFIYTPTGGAIALVASGRTVYQDYNQYLALAITNELCNATSSTMTGDIFRNAHNVVATTALDASNKNISINSLCYNFGGDPALPLYAASYQIALDAINGSTELASLTPLIENHISGHIVDATGAEASWFNGAVTLSVYGAARSVDTYVRRSTPSIPITVNDDLVAELTTTVTDGKFDASLVLPEPERQTSSFRMSLYATTTNADNIVTAIGYADDLSNTAISDGNESIIDTDITAPEIAALYLNSSEFTEGDCVEPTSTLYATILRDESGLNMLSSGLGGLQLTLDDASSYSGMSNYLQALPDGSYQLVYKLDALTDGHHTLRLSVSDNAGNISQRSISFFVRSITDASLSVDEYPATATATLHLKHAFVDTPSARIVIENANGDIVFATNTAEFPYTWNLCDNNNQRVADGEYKAYAILHSDKSYSSTPRTAIVVITE